MKRTLLAPLLAAGAALLAFNGQAQTEPGTKPLTIAFVRAGPDPYYQYGMDAASKAAKALGVNLVTYTSNGSPSQELANVQDAITRRVDGILMYGVSLSSERASIDRANRAKVPIFLQYGYDPALLPKVAGFMQIDLFAFAKPLGEWVARNVKEGKVAIIQGQLGRGDAEAYTKGFLEGLKANPKLQVVSTVAADWNRQKALTSAQQIITANPDLAALFVQNEDMAVGASLALARANKTNQVALVSMNGAPYGLDLIREGKLKITNANPPSIASVMALRLLINVIRGKTPPGRFYYAPTRLTDSTSIASATKWDAGDADITGWLELALPNPVIPAPR